MGVCLAVIRASGERTFDECYHKVSEIFGSSNVALIQNVSPFAKVVSKTIGLGINSDMKWTVSIDADVIPDDYILDHIQNRIADIPNDVFMFEGLVQDYLCFRYRPAGIHVYRNSLLQSIKDLVPRGNKYLRAESEFRNRAIAKGFSFLRYNDLYGYHDFEQDYFDIYRKCFMFSKKHKPWVRFLKNQYNRFKESNFDYLIALEGLEDGIAYDGHIENRIDFFHDRYYDLQRRLEFKEKSSLDGSYSSTNVLGDTFDIQYIPSHHKKKFNYIYERGVAKGRLDMLRQKINEVQRKYLTLQFSRRFES